MELDFSWEDFGGLWDTVGGFVGDNRDAIAAGIPLFLQATGLADSSFFQPDIPKVGYQGTVQKYDATREMADNFATKDRDKPRFPGAYGQRYFSDVAFTPSGDVDALADAQALTNAQARAIEADNAGRQEEIRPLLNMLNLRTMDNPYSGNLPPSGSPTDNESSGSGVGGLGSLIGDLSERRMDRYTGSPATTPSGPTGSELLALMQLLSLVNSGGAATGGGATPAAGGDRELVSEYSSDSLTTGQPPAERVTSPVQSGSATYQPTTDRELSLGGPPGSRTPSAPSDPIRTTTPSTKRGGAWVYGDNGQLTRRTDLDKVYSVDMGGGNFNHYESREDAEAALARLQNNSYAAGGLATLPESGRYLRGPSDGMADQRPAMIDGKQPAALSDGEFVVPADVVSHMGNGNSDAGAQRLEQMMAEIRKARTGRPNQAPAVDMDSIMGGMANMFGGK